MLGPEILRVCPGSDCIRVFPHGSFSRCAFGRLRHFVRLRNRLWSRVGLYELTAMRGEQLDRVKSRPAQHCCGLAACRWLRSALAALALAARAIIAARWRFCTILERLWKRLALSADNAHMCLFARIYKNTNFDRWFTTETDMWIIIHRINVSATSTAQGPV